MTPFEQDIFEALAQFHLTGDGGWLLEAIRRCGQYGVPIPPMVRQPFDEALRRYRSGEARSLDDAFSVVRPKGWNQSAHRLRYRKAWAIYTEIMRAHDTEGRPIDGEMFDAVGPRHGVSGPTARNYYREAKRLMARIQEEFRQG